MRNVLADLALEVEAATALMVRLARGYDLAAEDPAERAFARIATAVGKYWVCKRAPNGIGEAMECLGGNGYVEEAILARLYREAPVNAIWEGSGNVMCLDVLRALAHEGEAARAVLGALADETAELPGTRAAARFIETTLSSPEAEARARAAIGCLALLAAAAALRQSAPPEVAELFARTRIEDRHGAMFGASDIGADQARRLLERALPAA